MDTSGFVCTMDFGGGRMRVTVEQIDRTREEELIVRCYDPSAAWVSSVTEAASDHRTICGWQEDMAMAQWIYNFPAGLIDPGETPEESAKRELWEETGLELVRIDEVLDNSYSAIGFSNERNVCVFGVARGEFRKSTSDAEEIIPGWYTRNEILNLLQTEAFAARTQAYCYHYLNQTSAYSRSFEASSKCHTPLWRSWNKQAEFD